MWDARVCACVSTCVPSDALEQVLYSAMGLSENRKGRADILIYYFLGPILINSLECST